LVNNNFQISHYFNSSLFVHTTYTSNMAPPILRPAQLNDATLPHTHTHARTRTHTIHEDYRAGSRATVIGNLSFSNRWERIWRWSTISAGSV